VYAQTLFGMRLLHDGPPTSSRTLAITRAILRTNARIAPLDALHFASVTVRAARANGLPAEFLAATLLQESAFNPWAMSSAGAVGIAQFMPSTAAEAGVDPFDPYSAIDGAAELLASYARNYANEYPDPYITALAAYNAGPGAVDAYHGVPPYRETREYIDDIIDRWAQIAADELPAREMRASGE
jgi:peptidoglycan DL-endopeptidase CwlO